MRRKKERKGIFTLTTENESKKEIISRATKWYRAIRSSLIKWFGGRCAACGKKLDRRNAQFAHLKPTGLDGGSRGSYNRVKDVMMNPTCYILFCVGCHEDYDGERNQWRGQKNGKT